MAVDSQSSYWISQVCPLSTPEKTTLYRFFPSVQGPSSSSSFGTEWKHLLLFCSLRIWTPSEELFAAFPSPDLPISVPAAWVFIHSAQWWAVPALLHGPCPLALNSLVIHPDLPFSDSHTRTWLWWLIMLLSPTLSSPSISSGSFHEACKCCNFFQYLENLPLIPEVSLSVVPFSSPFRTQSCRSLLGSLHQLFLFSVFPNQTTTPTTALCLFLARSGPISQMQSLILSLFLS